jgi:hypothetical protein
MRHPVTKLGEATRQTLDAKVQANGPAHRMSTTIPQSRYGLRRQFLRYFGVSKPPTISYANLNTISSACLGIRRRLVRIDRVGEVLPPAIPLCESAAEDVVPLESEQS